MRYYRPAEAIYEEGIVVSGGTQTRTNGAGIDLTVPVCVGLAVSKGECASCRDIAQTYDSVIWSFTSDLPSVKRVRITQGTTVVYEKSIGESEPLSGVVLPGEVEVEIEFTESMSKVGKNGSILPVVILGAEKVIPKVAEDNDGGWRTSEGMEDSLWVGVAKVYNSSQKTLQLSIYAEDFGGNGIDKDENPNPTSTEPDGYTQGKDRNEPDVVHELTFSRIPPPFVRRLEVGSKKEYAAEFVPVDVSEQRFSFTQTGNTAITPAGNPHPLMIEFSRPVVESSIRFDSVNEGTAVISIVEGLRLLEGTTSIWLGSVQVMPRGKGGTTTSRLRISGKDQFGIPVAALGAEVTSLTGEILETAAVLPASDTKHTVTLNCIVPDNQDSASYDPTPKEKAPKGGINLGRLSGYKPWSIILPDGMPALQVSFGNFGSFRGVGFNLCNVPSNEKPDSQTGTIASKIAEEKQRLMGDGVPEHLAKVKLLSFGEQGVSAANAVTQTGAAGVGSALFNNMPFSAPPSILGFPIQRVELVMVGFKDISSGYSALLGILAATNSVTNPPLAFQMLTGSLGYLQEHGMDILKCAAYEYVNPAGLMQEGMQGFSKLPGGNKCKAFAEGQMSRGAECLMGSPPGGCSFLELASKATGLGSLYTDLNSLASLPERFPADLKSIQIMASNASSKGAVTISETGLLLQFATIPFAAASPTNAIPASFGILSSVLDTEDGNGSSSLSAQLLEGENT